MKRILVIVSAILLFISLSIAPASQTRNFSPLTYMLQDYDAAGHLVSVRAGVAHSYVQSFIFSIYTQASQTITAYTDTSNAGRNSAVGYTMMQAVAATGDATMGIVAGTGTNAVAQTDYALQTLIANGTGSGQLSYSNVTYTIPAVVGVNNSFVISRTLTNNSGGTITINEIALYGRMTGTGVAYYGCFIRDKLGSGQAVSTGHNVVISYTLATTF